MKIIYNEDHTIVKTKACLWCRKPFKRFHRVLLCETCQALTPEGILERKIHNQRYTKKASYQKSLGLSRLRTALKIFQNLEVKDE